MNKEERRDPRQWLLGLFLGEENNRRKKGRSRSAACDVIWVWRESVQTHIPYSSLSCKRNLLQWSIFTSFSISDKYSDTTRRRGQVIDGKFILLKSSKRQIAYSKTRFQFAHIKKSNVSCAAQFKIKYQC